MPGLGVLPQIATWVGVFSEETSMRRSTPRKEMAPRLRSGMPRPETASRRARRAHAMTACRSTGLSDRLGRNFRPPTPGGIPGIRECTMTTIVPCLYLRHGIGTVGCRRRQARQLSNPGGQGRNHAWRAGDRSIVHRYSRRYLWLTFDVNQSSRPSPTAVGLVVLNQAVRLLDVDGRA
jgi:hypothetical protein